MDGVQIFFKAVELIPRFIPKKAPPAIDYMQLRDVVNRYPDLPGEVSVAAPPRAASTEVRIQTTPSAVQPVQGVATACMSCSRSHLSTVSGALDEAMRFARDGGITHPEVVKRLFEAENEINIMERIDLSPESLQNSPPEEANVARQYLPRIRKLRQDIGNVASTEELERTAADASLLGQEFRLRHMQLRGVDLNPVLRLARKVQMGEMSMEAAKEELKSILPPDEV